MDNNNVIDTEKTNNKAHKKNTTAITECQEEKVLDDETDLATGIM